MKEIIKAMTNYMTTHNVNYPEINAKLMQRFFQFLGEREIDITKIAFSLATQESNGTYLELFSEADITCHFLMFMVQENEPLLQKIFAEQHTPIRDLLKLGLIKSDIELFKTC